MTERREAVSPPQRLGYDTTLRVIVTAAAELKVSTRDGWSQLMHASRAAVVERCRAEAKLSRSEELRHRNRARWFEWAARFIEGLGE